MSSTHHQGKLNINRFGINHVWVYLSTIYLKHWKSFTVSTIFKKWLPPRTTILSILLSGRPSVSSCYDLLKESRLVYLKFHEVREPDSSLFCMLLDINGVIVYVSHRGSSLWNNARVACMSRCANSWRMECVF